MKNPTLYLFTLLTLLLLNLTVSAQSNKFTKVYSPGSNLYVYSEGGLSIREKPDAKAMLISVVKFGEKVEVLPDQGTRVSFTSTAVPGTWVKVKQGDKQGYMFDGFLSRFAPMPVSDGDPSHFQNYLKLQFKIKSENNTPPEKEKYYAYQKMTFENGVDYSWVGTEGGSSIDTTFPTVAFTFQEVFLLARLVYPEFFPTAAPCAYKEDSMDCNVDENTSLTIIKKGTNYGLFYGHAD